MENPDKDWLIKMLQEPEIRQCLKKILNLKKKESTNYQSKKNRVIEKPIGSYVNDVDLKILKSIFKWKLLPTSTLKWMTSPNDKENTFIQRRIRLQDRNLIKHINLGGKISLYGLNDDGFSRIKHEVDGLKEDGYASEAPWHDFVTMTLQLGLWCVAAPKNVELISEQQMRRFDKSYLPYWMPDISLHRPDGYTRFKTDNKISLVAYEVELNRKSADRYDSVLQFYSSVEDVHAVIWLVKNKSLMNCIQNRAALFSNRIEKHCFILLDDFKSSFWNAKFIAGQETGRSLINMMSNLSHTDVNSLSKACHDTAVLDFQKKLLSI